MKKGWTVTKLIALGSLAVIDFFIWVLLGASIFFSTSNVFGASSALFISPFFDVFVALLFKQFGAVTLFELMRFFIGLPLPSIIPKPVNLVLGPFMGLVIDILSLFLMKKSKKLFSFAGGLARNFILSLELIALYFSIGFLGIQTVPPSFVTPPGLIICTIIISLIGGLPGYLAFLVFRKLENTAVVKRIQGG